MINPKIINQLIKDYVVERGGNNECTYEKYASGKLVQHGTVKVTSSVSTSAGALYRTAQPQNIRFAVPFIDMNYNITFGAKAALNSVYMADATVSDMLCYAVAYTSLAANTRYYFWQAIGKWK